MTSYHNDINRLAKKVGELLVKQNQMLVTAESCTGGWVAEAVTAIAGSSQWFERGFVTYSNLSKQELLAVPAMTLQTYGAVSAETAEAMVLGALQQSAAQVALAITGIAGPGGGSEDKPVGLVYFAWAGIQFAPSVVKMLFNGDRAGIRRQAVIFSLEQLILLLRNL